MRSVALLVLLLVLLLASSSSPARAQAMAPPVFHGQAGPLLAVYQAKPSQGIQGCWLLDTPEGRMRFTIYKQGHYTFFGRLESPSWLNRPQGDNVFAVESNDKYPPGTYRGSQYAHDSQGLTLSTALEIVDQGGRLAYRLFERYKFDVEPVTVYTMTSCD